MSAERKTKKKKGPGGEEKAIRRSESFFVDQGVERNLPGNKRPRSDVLERRLVIIKERGEVRQAARTKGHKKTLYILHHKTRR